eukprot:TRINITY_DN15162_c0_g1_i1.p1 TRINITY_DN15162_c0_g1~~TRINITY_DN15162_c0_g1_i1.p1  ORF type:complete len:228 (+),score=45.89 TRINITY_DN15162_c0_g1_i1:26-709(+)
MEAKIRAATHDDGYKPSPALLKELADASRSYKNVPIMMNVIWKRLGDHGKNWKRIYKSLFVLEYLLLNGSEQILFESTQRKFEIQTLCMFQHAGKFDGKDIGLHVREKAKAIMDIIDYGKPTKGEPKSTLKEAPTQTTVPQPESFASFQDQHAKNNPYGGPQVVTLQDPVPVQLHSPVPVQLNTPQPVLLGQPVPVSVNPFNDPFAATKNDPFAATQNDPFGKPSPF